MKTETVVIEKGGKVTASYCNITKMTPEEVHIITDALAYQQDRKETYDGEKWDSDGIRETLLLKFIQLNDSLNGGVVDGSQ